MKKEELLKIGREYHKKGPTILAKELKVSKQRIQQIAYRFRKAGVNIPRLREHSIVIDEVVLILKKELNKNK